MRKVLMLINYYGRTSETFISDEIEYLMQQDDLELHILHYNESIPESRVYGLYIPKSFFKRLLHNPSLFSFDFLRSLKYRNGQNATLGYLIHFFKHNEYDTIYCHFGTNGKLIAELKDLGIIPAKTKLVVRFHGLDMNLNKYPAKYYSVLKKYTDTFIVGSTYALSKLKQYQLPLSKIVLLPVGVKINPNKRDFTKKLENEKIRIISIGRLVSLKGYIEAVEIIAKLKNRDQIILEIIGTGPEEEEIRNKIKINNLEETVILLNKQSHAKVLEKIRDSDIYIYSGKVDKEGRAESQGLANIEAMAAGCVIVAFNVGGLADYIIDEKTGFLIPPQKLDEFTSRLDWVIDNLNSTQIEVIRENAFNYILANFDQDKLQPRLKDILIE
ncbi:MAG: glycosyltransferase family 4 protein [Weeksellaceae bacterium]|nr:glycosyltransferase family 4 protein [Weeksellaceae bacterium]